ncbi:Fe2+-dependent dioxygenase [Planktomarina temperata]|nr:Fe2+-dependent dioxygenase [Planktomarina temperata]
MISTIELLTPEDCLSVRKELEKFKFADGKNSATGGAKELKENFQLESTFPEATYIFDGVRNIIKAHPFVAKNILPVSFPRLFANYYAGGHKYDWHVDSALMNGARTDYSFTISLKDPDSYEGGALEMHMDDGEIVPFRLPEGHMVIYPTGQLHRVTEVTSGFRLSIVGWMQSAFCNEEDRSLHAEFLDLMAYFKEKYELSWEEKNKFYSIKQKMVRRLIK